MDAECIKNRISSLLPPEIQAVVGLEADLLGEVCVVSRKFEKPVEERRLAALGPKPTTIDEILAYKKRRCAMGYDEVCETIAKIKETAKILRKNGIRYKTIDRGMRLIVLSIRS